MGVPTTRIAVLGGGVSGLVLAHELSKSSSIQVDLYERTGALGGFHKSVAVNGLEFDIGAFVFAHWHELFRSFPWMKEEMLRVNYLPQSVRGSGVIDRYPLSLGSYRRQFGLLSTARDLFAVFPEKIRSRRRDTLIRHVSYYIGAGIYRKSGLKAYIERLYQMEDREIDVLFAAQRMEYLRDACSFRMRAKKLFNPKLPDFRTDTYFVRPEQGFHVLYDRIGETLSTAGVRLRLNASIDSIRVSDAGPEGRFRIDGESYDRLVSTIPVPALAKYLGLETEAPFETVRLVTLFYRFKGDAGFTGCSLFNFTTAGNWKRLVMFSRYYGQADGADYFSVECILKERDERSADFARRDFETHARQLNLFRGDLEYQGNHETSQAYPVFRTTDSAGVEHTKARIQALGIDLLGRQGAFEYLSSSQAALKSRALGRTLLD